MSCGRACTDVQWLGAVVAPGAPSCPGALTSQAELNLLSAGAISVWSMFSSSARLRTKQCAQMKDGRLTTGSDDVPVSGSGVPAVCKIPVACLSNAQSEGDHPAKLHLARKELR